MPTWAVTVEREQQRPSWEPPDVFVHTVDARTAEEAEDRVAAYYARRAGTTRILSVFRVQQMNLC